MKTEIQLVCKEAAMIPLRKVFNILETGKESSASLSPSLYSHLSQFYFFITLDNVQFEAIQIDPITTHGIKTAVSHTKPSAKRLTSKYIQWQEQYEST